MPLRQAQSRLLQHRLDARPGELVRALGPDVLPGREVERQAEPLEPDTEYEVVIPVGGVTDVSGNAVTAAFRSTFRTVDCP